MDEAGNTAMMDGAATEEAGTDAAPSAGPRPASDVRAEAAVARDPGFLALVEAHAWDEADDEATARLEAEPGAWQRALLELLHETDEALTAVRRARSADAAQAVADLEGEQARLERVLDRLLGIAEPEPPAPAEPAVGPVALQLSWADRKLVAWAGGPGQPAVDRAGLEAALAATASPSIWENRAPVQLPDGSGRAAAAETHVGAVLGWLLADCTDRDVDGLGASARWLGHVAAWAVELVAKGAMVPHVRRIHRKSRQKPSYVVTWTPALVDVERLRRTAESMPGAVGVLGTNVDAPTLTRSVLAEVVDVICRDAAKRVEVPAAPPETRTPHELAETLLAHLDGSAFEAPAGMVGDLTSALDRWSAPVTGKSYSPLVVQLDPPDSGDAWHLAVFAQSGNQRLTPVEVALVNAGNQRREMEANLVRLERLFEPLKRPGSLRRGEVVLSQAEAWELMTEVGPVLRDAGFDVRVPALSRRTPTPSLRLWAEGGSTAVGANQLADVRWTAVFDDVELSAADIRRLAAEARPLVRVGGRWVALDHADLAAAADALAERADRTRMSGAEMLRQALGLDGSPLAGGISISGSGWAADLLEKASTATLEPAPDPEGFTGALRSYQGEALAWLGFLESTGLGGCLALDMGLGKTPTLLAHLVGLSDDDPALVIAPPAVVGNWASEARKFTPGMKVVVHHGASRASAESLAAEVDGADVVITTYSTAVRDIEALEKVHFSTVVLDEAQAIKNPANETSQQLRRLDARTRLALTGTPIENGLGDLWAILDFTNPGLVGPRPAFVAALSVNGDGRRDAAEKALRALNGILVFRRTKSEPAIAAELPDRIDELDHCSMTPEQIGLYQAVLDALVTGAATESGADQRKGQVLAAITALKQICNHPVAYRADDGPLEGRSGKLARLEEIVEVVYAAEERVLVFTHFAEWGVKLAEHLTRRFGIPVGCYHGGLSRGARDTLVADFQALEGPGALVLSLKAGGTGLNLTNANHVVLYDRWWNPAVEDQARDRAWRIGQTKTVIAHRLVCPGTVDERVEEVVAGKRHIADLVLPKSSSLGDLDAEQVKVALGLRPDEVLTEVPEPIPAVATEEDDAA
ncbi:MAG: DEAD/DEAH box helicase [Acidimicrobiales bacterium]|nr:DEAD/DEAH box helicase [Acidimicrobiales bacterium]